MNKDFDGAAWAASHDQDFQTLIARARRKATPKIGHASNIDKAGDIALGHDDSTLDISTKGSPQDAQSKNKHRKDSNTPGNDRFSPAQTSSVQIDTDD